MTNRRKRCIIPMQIEKGFQFAKETGIVNEPRYPMRRAVTMIMLMLILLLPSCSAPQSAFAQDGRIKITATLFPQYDFARIVGGERVEVMKLLPSGAESHTYEPSARNIVTVQDSDLFLYTGREMEPWAETLLKGMDKPPMSLDLSEGIAHVAAPHEHHGHGGETEQAHEVNDPHIWTTPRNAVTMTERIRDALTAIDPEGKEIYEANAAAYISRLQALDRALSDTAERAEEKTLVFGGRFAFAHLCDAYGLEAVSAYRGCDVEAEPSAADIAAVIEFVKTNKISYIFREEMVSRRSVNAIAGETGAQILLLHSCHNVTGEELAAGVTYLSLMEQNAANLQKALLGTGA